jgi:ParB family chromosome partitioning protein
MTPTSVPTRIARIYPLKDLGVAPENLRFDQAADPDIPQLAATLLAAGQLQPLTVRPGRRKEKPAMALDGRRRLLAFQLLLAHGEIGEDHPVAAFEETDPARQAAAALLTNTGVPVHVADVIVAIGRMLKARLSPATMAAALGYAELEVRRLAVLADLDPQAIAALRAGKLTLRQAKLLARLKDPEVQAEIAGRVLQGYAFPDYRVSDALQAGRLTGTDRRCALVGASRYAAAGGRIETDLFGELPEVWLDPEALDRAWLDRAAALAGGLQAGEAAVQLTVEPGGDAPQELEPVGDVYAQALQGEAREAWRGLALDADLAQTALQGQDLADPASDPALLAYLQARLAADRASEPDRRVSLLVLRPDTATGVALKAYGPAPMPTPDEAPSPDGLDLVPDAGPGPVPPAPDVQGVNPALHEVRTDAATRVLIRAVAGDPEVALVALAARLFDVLVLHEGRARGAGALTLIAEAYGRPRGRVIAALDGEVRQRLLDRRTAWQASGQTVIAWVAEAAAEDRMALLADLVALSLDLREERPTAIRGRAREEAAALAALCGPGATRGWPPDEVVLGAHSKGQLLGMLEAMDAEGLAAEGLKKVPLVELVAEQALKRNWIPDWLAWGATAEAQALETDVPATEAAG